MSTFREGQRMQDVAFTVHIFKEGGTFVAHVPELDVSSCGDTAEIARHNVQDAVRGFIDTAQEMGTLLGRDFFPLVLSPVYSPDHPRQLAWRQPVIVLQPESSFTRHGISSKARDRARLSTLTEYTFLNAGKLYHGRITRTLPKAFRVIKPLLETDPPVRWWGAVLLTDLTTLQHRGFI